MWITLQVIGFPALIFAFAGGVGLLIGRKICKDRFYELRGKQRLTAKLLGRPTSYSGEDAVRQGRRIIIMSYVSFGLGGVCAALLVFVVLLETAANVSSLVSNPKPVSTDVLIDPERIPGMRRLENEFSQFPKRVERDLTKQPRAPVSLTNESREARPQPSKPSLNEPIPNRKSLNFHKVTRDQPAEASEDIAPEGGYLVGMEVELADQGSYPLVGLTPIYEVGGDQKRGKLLGISGASRQRILAEPNHVVIGVVLYQGEGIQLKTARLNADGRIDTENATFTKLIGEESSWDFKWDSSEPIVGVRTSLSPQWNCLNELGVYTAAPATLHKVAATPSKKSPEQANDRAISTQIEKSFRTWSSQDNKFHVEAKLVKKIGDKAQLEKRDGTLVSVQIAKLSKSDQEYIGQFGDLD